ncbi:hypothetical protein [Vibrio sp. Isolate24]|uniref:hypothetical protein n=1 Tax=Vibrio sp. Isolate24 TaxID=2908534 RepID=UPI001EFEBAB1|nr:hypothetical protein [Vibrio sp. Isolate24]MCG9680451.1 hypothetical protein [Vibrio sp. Isolate24]
MIKNEERPQNDLNEDSLERMDESGLKDDYLKKIRSQFKLWESFLNNAIGVLAFTLGLASLGTPIPCISATLSLFVVIFIWWQGQSLFPKEVTRLRKMAKKDYKSKVILSGVMTEQLSWLKAVTRYPMYLLGFLFLILVAVSPFVEKVLIFNGHNIDIFSKYFGLT